MKKFLLSVVVLRAVTLPLSAQPPPGMGMGAQNWDDFRIDSPVHVAGNIHMVTGGIIVNMAFSLGGDGIVLVDSNFAALNQKIVASIREVSDDPIRFLIDTHSHADHADGNVSFAESGAVVVAHDTVRMRLSNPPQGDPAPEMGLPIMTFSDRLSLHVNGEEVEAIYVTAAHTDGDVLIYFRGSDVIHMGDVFVGQYPIIDTSRGGSYVGLIETLNAAINLVGPETAIIPGHGPIFRREDMIEYRNALLDIHDRVSVLVVAGSTLEEIIAARPSADHDARWAGGRGSDNIVRAAYDEITRQ